MFEDNAKAAGIPSASDGKPLNFAYDMMYARLSWFVHTTVNSLQFLRGWMLKDRFFRAEVHPNEVACDEALRSANIWIMVALSHFNAHAALGLDPEIESIVRELKAEIDDTENIDAVAE